MAWGVVLAAAALLAPAGCGHKHASDAIAPALGTLVVDSTPEGAEVFIDGKDSGSITPDDFTLASGTHRVAVSLPGRTFVPPSSSVSVPADGVANVSFSEFAPLLTPDTTAHDFGAQDLATTSSEWCVRVTNRGTAPDSGTFAVSGPQAADFSIVSGAAYHAFGPGASQQVCLDFHPSGQGLRTAAIVMGGTSLALTGRGHLVPCRLVPDATAHDFGTQVAGSPDASWCFTVTNQDVAACLDTLALAGAGADQFAITQGGILSLAPGASASVCVSFHPTAAGPANASLTVGETPVTLAATGSGACALGTPATPDGTTFGATCVDAVVGKRVSVPNSGNLACTVSATSCGPFAVSPASAVAPPGGAATFTVSYRPVAAGSDGPCNVGFASGAQSWSVPFSGTGISQPIAEFTPQGGVAGHAGDAIAFTSNVQANGSPVTSYAWDFGDGGTSTSPNPTHRYSGGGSYTVTLTATNACGASPLAMATVCVDEPAYLIVYNFDTSNVPSYVTNIPGWGSDVPIVLYRGTNASIGELTYPLCGGITAGEHLNTTHGVGAAEALGIPGQTFTTAALPVPRTECGVHAAFSFGASTKQTTPPAAYVKTGSCDHVQLGKVPGDDLFCTSMSADTHCGLANGDNHLEWGLEAQSPAAQVYVSTVTFTYQCWYVCPQGAPRTGAVRVVERRPDAATTAPFGADR